MLSLLRRPRVDRSRQNVMSRPQCYRPSVEYLEERRLLSGGFTQVNLVSDVPGLARFTDFNLVNPWGLAFSPTGPFWFANQASGVANARDGRGELVPFFAAVPSATGRAPGSPTGVVFNGGPGFVVSGNGASAPSRFLFATEDGTISGWSEVVDPSRAFLAVDDSSAGANYLGLALATDVAGHTLIYAADFRRGSIAVFDERFHPVVSDGAFCDENLPSGYAPFNIQAVGDRLLVAYAQHDDEDPGEGVAGAGLGFIDMYDTAGTLVRRLISGGELNAPWGMTLAPPGFGSLNGALLVGNNGDGHINAFDPESGAFLGRIVDDGGATITIPDLWTIKFGNGHLGGAADVPFFAAGVDDEGHGLFGAIQPAERRSTDTGGPGKFDPSAPGEPDDYPLPPRNGPARPRGADDSVVTVALLLPMSESSLAVVPNLSTVTLPAATEDIRPINVTVASESVDWLPSTVVLTSSNLRMPPTADGSETQLSAPPEAIALSEFLNVDVGERVSRSLDLQTRDIARKSEGRRGAFLPTDLPSAALLDASLAAALETMQNDGPDFSGEARPETDSSDWACWTKMIAPILIGGSLPVLWHWLQSRVTSRAIRRVQ